MKCLVLTEGTAQRTAKYKFKGRINSGLHNYRSCCPVIRFDSEKERDKAGGDHRNGSVEIDSEQRYEKEVSVDKRANREFRIYTGLYRESEEHRETENASRDPRN